MAELPVDKKFRVLCDITRAQHFAWREAVKREGGEVAARKAVLEMWRCTGEQTGQSYAKRIDKTKPLALQVAQSVEWSSQCMGETASAEAVSGRENEALLRHTGCPWHGWHERLGLLEEDQPGCDAWLQTTVQAVNDALGTKLRCETLDSLPAGGSCCLRRLWTEET